MKVQNLSLRETSSAVPENLPLGNFSPLQQGFPSLSPGCFKPLTLW